MATGQSQLIMDEANGLAQISLFLPQQLDQVRRICEREDFTPTTVGVVKPFGEDE